MVITDDRLEPATERDLLAQRTRRGCAGILASDGTAASPAAAPGHRVVRRCEHRRGSRLGNPGGSLAKPAALPGAVPVFDLALFHPDASVAQIRPPRPSRPISLAWLPFVRGRELQQQQQTIASSEASPADAASQKELFSQVRMCLEALPEKHRQVIRLRFFEDATLPDIAVILGCSLGTVKSRLHHALEKLRKMKLNLPDLRGDQPL